MRVLAAALLLALAACGPKALVAPPSDDPHPLPVPYTGGPLGISREAVGPLRWDVARTVETLQALFPDAKIERRRLDDGQDQVWILIVEREGQPILEAVDRANDPIIASYLRAFEVRVAAGQPVGPAGEHLLDRWSRLGLKSADCAMGEGRDRFALICPSAKAPNVKLVFGVPGWTADQAPPASVLTDKAFLREFIWTYDEGIKVRPPS